jgi:hypothetical protein
MSSSISAAPGLRLACGRIAFFRLSLMLGLFCAPLLTAAPFSLRLLQSETPWGDGQAELAIFRGTEKRYGLARETEVRHILVREHFAADALVKADDWRAPGAYPVFKLNQLIVVPTGTYRYDQGHSSFWRVADGALLKFAHTTNDACGLTYKRGERLGTGADWRYRALTYWDGMDDVDTRAAAPADALFYDELPFRLRLLDWENARSFRAPLMASVIGSRAEPLAWPEAEFSVTREGETWRVGVRHARGEDRFWFDAAAPHALRVWERWDATRLERVRLQRLPYWELNRPGDEARLELPQP